MKPTIVLTHDSDSIHKPLSHVLARKKRFRLVDIVKHAIGVTNLYNNFTLMAEAEEKLGYRSTIFIPVGLFSLDDIVDLLKTLQKDGWEIGYHPVISSNQTFSLLKMGLEYLNYLGLHIKGVRAHYLITSQKLLEYYSKLGLIYDSSMRAEELGTYNTVKLKDIVEIPVALMDADVFGRLMIQNEEKAFKYILWKLSQAEKDNAKYFTLLFHQEALRMRGGRLYFKLLEYLHEKEYSVKKCIDVAEEARK